ncbi:MAG: Gfo/Idh/MocA family oxidoreductase [Armatimonadetes bacterium]|nr:Gfo/Idh/MocA family oxidoreductase [Armatimonadota bacterium]
MVKIGVIGAGAMGSAHCKSIAALPETELVFVCDRRPEKASAIAGELGVPAFTDSDQAIASSLAQAVLIATPHHDHAPIAIAAFSAGLGALVEKPLSVTVGDADAMIEAAGNLPFAVMYQTRTEPYFRKAVELSKEIGELRRASLVTAWYRNQAYYDSGGWRATWAGEGGGVLINQAPHYLDFLVELTGLPVKLRAETRTRFHDMETEDEAWATMEYANGAHGYLYATTGEAPPETTIELAGDRGKLLIRGEAIRFWSLKDNLAEFTRQARGMWDSPEWRDIPIEMPDPAEPRHHAAVIRNFARFCMGHEPLIAPGHEGLAAVELINAIYLSAFVEDAVHIPVDRPAIKAVIQAHIRQSKPKERIAEQSATDPKFLP